MKKVKRKNILMLQLLSIFLFAFCCAAKAQVEVVDYLGRRVTLDRPAKRVVVLAPHIAENIASAGGVDTLVGAVDYCDYPESVKQVPRVGNSSHFSIEAILSLKPDLVVVWSPTKAAKSISRIESLGIKTYASDPRTLEDVARSITDFGVLLGTQKTANKAAEKYLKKLEALSKFNSNEKTVGVFYQVWSDPLQTLNDEHIISDVIRLCGGKNVFGDLPVLVPKVSVESVLAQNPDVIVAGGTAEELDLDEQWNRWPQISAVKNNHLYLIPPDLILRHTARILDGAELMCESLNKLRISNVISSD